MRTEIKRAFIVMLFAALAIAGIIVAPLNIYAADECDATISSEGLIHIPVVRYQDNTYTLDMQYLGTSGSVVELSVEKVEATSQDCPAESEVTSLSPLTLKIVSLAIGSDNYDITLTDATASKIKAAQTPGIFDKSYDYKIFDQRSGRYGKALFKVSLSVLVVSKNSDVWKGKSECTRDVSAVYPGGTAYATAKGRNVTFARDTTVSLSDTGYALYKVSGGSLTYRAYENYNGLQSLETASTSAMSSSDGNIKMTITSSSSEAAGTGTLSFERTGTATTDAGYCNYSGIAYAEWLYIPSIIFSSASKPMTEVMRTGKVIEKNKMPGGCNGSTCKNPRTWHCTAGGTSFDIPGIPDFAWLPGDLTCTWSFKYYP